MELDKPEGIKSGAAIAHELGVPFVLNMDSEESLVAALKLLKEAYSAYAENIRSDVIMSSAWRDWTDRVSKEMKWT